MGYALRSSLTLLLAVLLLLAVPLSATAQVITPAEAIEILATSHTPDFPRQVGFALKARGAADIVKATLRFKQVGQATVTTSRLKFAPSRAVELHYDWDLQRHYVPPGVEIEYYWLLEDAEGRTARTPAETFLVEDKRFAWRSVADGPVRVYWYEGDEPFARELLAAGRRALDQLAADAGVTADTPVKVFVYASQRDLLSALRPSAQEWTGGQAFTEQSIVVVAVEPSDAGLSWGRRVLPHEISHVVVHRMTKNPYGDLPSWLDEGLAMYAEGELEASYRRRLAEAIDGDRLISVRSLAANFPSDPEVALLSYAQSHSLVSFIIDEYGADRLAKLLSVFKEGSTYDDALQAALGVDTAGLEAAWRASVGAPPAAARRAAPGGEERNAPLFAVGWALPVLAAAAVGLGLALLLLRSRSS